MCGIAGIIYKNGNGAHRIGRDITQMLQSMKHRGPDSTGVGAVTASRPTIWCFRVKLADASDLDNLDGAADIRRRHDARPRPA